MLQVLLVDDEPWVLEGLRTMVNWEKHGFRVCGEALDGPRALAMIEKLQPELVFTDIHMPAITGLELIEWSQQALNRPPQFVILSGYDDFNYALTAMRQRAVDYLLKPIDEEEIEALLAKLGQKITNELAAERSMPRKRSLFVNNLLNRLIQEEGGEALQIEAAKSLGLPGEPELRCALIDAGADAHSLSQRVGAFFAQDTGRFFQDRAGRTGVILRAEDMADSRPEEIGLAVNRELAEWKEQALVTVSGIGKGIGSIRELYLQALDLNRAKRSQGKTGLFFHGGPAAATTRQDATYKGRLRHLPGLVEAGEPEMIGSAIEEAFAALTCGQADIAAVQADAANLELTLCRQMASFHGDPDGFMKRMQTECGSLGGMADYAALKRYVHRLCLEAAVQLGELKRRSESNTIFQVIRYVDGEYSSKLQLQTLAQKFHMNPAYLGQLFKKETGKPFNEYLNMKRIEEAKRLLKRTPMKISEIALRVGYPNTDYFLSKFKQATGVLPSVYKQEPDRKRAD
ncbi:response regulator [Paenibacillus macerans]|uniref:response regulator transcription factor n=1 Tax=Paenibacillus macerans TaxID=44252 RepID=UPI0020403E43|nr:response regulator [Paenibacillus macerans]MCM3703529.1 response regulator [Paenibacillus macerans]